MFEGIKPFVNAQNVARARQAERESADAYEAIGEWKAHAAGMKAQIQQRDARISELEAALTQSEANAKGCAAQAKALLDTHPDTPLMVDSGVPWKSKHGNKTKLRRIYEQAYDAYARTKGIANPEQIRND